MALVSVLVSWTSAFGTIAPEGSATTPATEPVVEVCAREFGAKATAPDIASTARVHARRRTLPSTFNSLMKSLLPSLFCGLTEIGHDATRTGTVEEPN